MGNAGDKIVYSSASLDRAVRRLQQVSTALQQEKSSLLSALSQLDRIEGGDCRIQGRIQLTTVGASYSAGSVNAYIREMGRALTAESGYASTLAGKLGNVSEMFANTERELVNMANGVSTGDNPFDGAAGEGGTSGSRGNTPAASWADKLKDSFDLGKLGKKAVTSFGPIGKTIGLGLSIIESFQTGEWKGTLKDGAKTVVSWVDFLNKYKWANYKKTNNFGNNYGTKNYVKRLTNMATKATSTAASWGSKVVDNFKTGLKDVFVTKKGGANWAGIAGVVIDFGFSLHDNMQQVKAGEISVDRGIVETVAETAANVVIATAAGAIAAATLPVSAPAAAVAVASAGIVWAADGVTKLITGGDKGLGEVISEGVGEVYDAGKKAVAKAADFGAKLTAKAVDKGAELLSNLRNKVIGRSRACWI